MAEAMCYPSAYHYLRKLAKEAKWGTTAVLVHGTITLPNGQRIAHAWVEAGDEAVDAKQMDKWRHCLARRCTTARGLTPKARR